VKIDFAELVKNMGVRYVCFRIWYEVMRRSGWMRLKYRTLPLKLDDTIVDRYKKYNSCHTSLQKPSVPYSDDEKKILTQEYQKIRSGWYPFFSGTYLEVGHGEWLRNPKSGYTYDSHKHWTEIADIDATAGDIKFVWEKARFSWVYTLIRSDVLLGTDSFDFIIKSMQSFVRHASINCGPQWRCGQEIALRVINWLMVLQFYREEVLRRLCDSEIEEIITSIHEQMKHVYDNRKFARIAVRNNHAISEALGLYTAGLMCPYLKTAASWKKDGWAALQKEALYQIYPDGSYIQHSFNYQRVVVQQYTLALALAKSDNLKLHPLVTRRLEKLCDFMLSMQNEESGMLPNYGANDGALFFPFGRGNYRDYRPQLNAFHVALYGTHCYAPGSWFDDSEWLFGETRMANSKVVAPVRSFNDGGYYTMTSGQLFVMVRCANYKHRPAQADQLHLDIWYNGINILHDCGSYTYNMADELFGYFAGTLSHNTVMIDGRDQMERGPRFIWYKWPKRTTANFTQQDTTICFEGTSIVYRNICQYGVAHCRSVRIPNGEENIEVIDTIDPAYKNAFQLWHYLKEYSTMFSITAVDQNGSGVEAMYDEGHFSDTYGIHVNSRQMKFAVKDGYLKTTIKCKAH